MIIGDKGRFAAEFELDADDGGAWMYGKFRFWVEGAPLGDYDLGTSLRDVLFGLTRVVKDNGRRRHEALFELPADTAFTTLDRALYGGPDSPDEGRALEERWGRFELGLCVDALDGWRMYLIEKAGRYKVVYRRPDEDGAVRQALLDAREVDAVLARLFEELDLLYEQRAAPEA